MELCPGRVFGVARMVFASHCRSHPRDEDPGIAASEFVLEPTHPGQHQSVISGASSPCSRV